MRISKENLIKILIGAGIAGGGAILAYLLEAVPNMELGIWAPLVTALLSILINMIRKIEIK